MNSPARKENVATDRQFQEELLIPPKPPRSAFMCFTDAKKREILAQNQSQKDEDVLKIVALTWRELDESERAYWDEEARNDKVRFVREKNDYKGPWNLPKRRAKKHPLAPKRPMSAFLKYSQRKRSGVKEQNPDMSNTDVSRLLGEMWRNASDEERRPYVEDEESERANYKERIKEWRDEQGKIDAASRTSHHSVQRQRRDEPREANTSREKRSRYQDDSGQPRSVNFETLQITRAHATDNHDRAVFRSYNGPFEGIHHRSPNTGKVDLPRSSLQHRPQPLYPYAYMKTTGKTAPSMMTLPIHDDRQRLHRAQSTSFVSENFNRVDRASSGNNIGSNSADNVRKPSPTIMYPNQNSMASLTGSRHESHPDTQQHQHIHPQTRPTQQPFRSSRQSYIDNQYNYREHPHQSGPSPPPPPPPPEKRNDVQPHDPYNQSGNMNMHFSDTQSSNPSARSASNYYQDGYYHYP